ncbi:MAG TPA: hypothetical protein VFA18_24395, partial [Gemmataceae bacterium]|nr:hypothetical protein [Gemmataceae bacterium]
MQAIHPIKDPGASRRGVILLVVLAFLALFALVGLTFLYYANTTAQAARFEREAQTLTRPDAEPELLLSYFLGQLLYDVPDDETGVYSGLRGHSLARNLFGLNYTIAANGTLLLGKNDVPFNGTGRLPFPFAPLGKNEQELINYTYFPVDSFLRDPERPGSRPGLRPAGTADNRTRFAGGFNAPYTYPDLNNVFLAAVKAGAATSSDGVHLPPGTVLLPSFHRPWVFGSLTDRNNPNWTNHAGKYLLLRPRPADMGPGFPYPEDEGGDVKNLIAGPGYYDGHFTKRLHGNDSVWIDLDFPVLRSPDGRKYKPLFAPLIVDLDNRVNLNVHGNLRGLNFGNHASNTGWGAWEVNLGRVLDADASEWAALLKGDQHLGGRYGLSRNAQQNHPHSLLPGNLAPAIALPRFYAPIDFDGSNEKALGQPTDRRALPGTPPTRGFHCFPADANGYGNDSVAERRDHPSLFNPLRPTAPDRLLGLAGLEGLLRYGDTGSEALGSELLRLCPKNFRDLNDPASSAKRRGLVTLRSFDLDRPGLLPWFRPGDGGNYLRMQSLSPQPVGGAIASPSLAELLAPNSASEFGPDGRAAMAWTDLRRLDLSRLLPDYPNPDASGRITDLAGFRLAQNARQTLAAEIFERLWKTTGAGNPQDPTVLSPPGTPAYNAERWNALRFLAQLAVNIVDFIDNDDYLTPFNWYPPYSGKPVGEWVYG